MGAAFYEETHALLDAAGLPAYEISNHARPGGECRHNLIYWSGGDWVGVGPGAHGRLTGTDGARTATRQARAPDTWLTRVEAQGHATVERSPIDRGDAAEELLMMGLRLARGVSRGDYRRTAGVDLEERLDAARLDALVEEDLITLDAAGLRCTPAGRQRLNAVLAHLLG